MRDISKNLRSYSYSQTMGFVEKIATNFFGYIGGVTDLSRRTIIAIFKYRFNTQEFFDQLYQIGNKSLGIVFLTVMFTGMVLALQFSVGLARFGLKMYGAPVVALCIARELGPVLTSIMIAARVGSGITAELGSMVVTEQIMAIEAMGANPLQKLVVPRVLATILATPLLATIANLVGILGGMIITVREAGVTRSFYMNQTWQALYFDDVIHGIAKTIVFGFFVAIIACYEGLNTGGGTHGVGKATTRAVVYASLVIFVADFFLTKLFILF